MQIPPDHVDDGERATLTGTTGAEAQAEQVRSVTMERVDARLGVVPNAMMLEIDEALRLHLGL